MSHHIVSGVTMSEVSNAVRVRFAPSPTGYLHVGGARTALFNWLFARHNKGTFIVRIEDTDQSRYSEAALKDLLRDLKWLGMDWDEGPGVNTEGQPEGSVGKFGPYQQSLRLTKYHAAADELLSKGLAYRCFCSSERLAELREKQQEAGGATGYDRCCRDLSTEDSITRAANEEFVVRLKVPLEGETSFTDLIRGPISTPNNILDDMVLLKRDKFPTYHLANVVDDHDMKISHVLRGDEWIPSTSRHVLLYQAFGWSLPVFAHLPIILAPGGGKLSKRKGAASVGDFEEKGILPEALFNFLALLGWSPGDDREKMSLEEIINAFEIERIQSKGAAFDEAKLEWLNGQYFIQTPAQELLPIFTKECQAQDLDISGKSDTQVIAVIEIIQERIKVRQDMPKLAEYFFKAPTTWDAKVAKKAWKEDSPKIISHLCKKLKKLNDWSETALELEFQATLAELEVGFGPLGKPTRLALSGLAGGPSLYAIMTILGKEDSISRLENAISNYEIKT